MEARLLEFKKNILLWYPFKENASIFHIENGYEKLDKQYDYITIIGKYSSEFEQKLLLAKNYIKEDGKILIAIDNQFGLKNWNTTNALEKDISKNTLLSLFEQNQLHFTKFYYVFPNFEMANLIYSEDYSLTEEDITRNFAVYPQNTIIHLNENDVYQQLLKEDKTYVNQFANSFFIEVSQKPINTDIKYVAFTNYRKPEYRMMTLIKEDVVIKKVADKQAQNHMEQMERNIQELRQMGIDVIENKKDGQIISQFIKHKRFDIVLSETSTIEEFMEKFQILKEVLNKDTCTYEDLIKDIQKEKAMITQRKDTYHKEKEQLFTIKKCIQMYHPEKLKSLHFLRRGFIDLIPKNCFYIEGNLKVFDQEWIEYNIPVEYIYYRALLNTTNCLEKLGKESLLKAFRNLGICGFI